MKIEFNFDLKDFETMEDTEHTYFEDENITNAQEVLRWYEKNNLTCVGVRKNGIIIANVNILPIQEAVFRDICNNKMNEADITAEQIEQYEDNKSYYIYLSSITVNKEYKNNYKVIMTLLRGCLELFKLLESRNIAIKKVMADASTLHGEKICNKLLKMEYITNTSHNSKIYLTSGDKILETIKRLKEHILKR